jgi:hypothetical protein
MEENHLFRSNFNVSGWAQFARGLRHYPAGKSIMIKMMRFINFSMFFLIGRIESNLDLKKQTLLE